MSTSKRSRLWGKLTGKDKDEGQGSNRLSPGRSQTSARLSLTSLTTRGSRPTSVSGSSRLPASAIPNDHAEPEAAGATQSEDRPKESDQKLSETQLKTAVTAQPQTSPKESDQKLSDLWLKAADLLRADPDPEKRSLIEQYCMILKEQLGSADDGETVESSFGLRPSHAAKILTTKAEELKERKLTLGAGKQEVNIEPYFNNVAKHIIAAKDLINSASSADSHASVACAGVVVILTFLIRQVEQREHLFKGLELISSLICRYLLVESIYRPRSRVASVPEAAAKELENDLENNLVNLYSKILEFQARALCYVQRGRANQFFRDTFRGDVWKTLIADIKDLDNHCRAFANLVTNDRIHEFLDEQKENRLPEQVSRGPDPEETARIQEQQSECLQLLYTCPYRDRKDINPERVDGTCEWFVKHEYFQDWKESPESKLLWVSADPGCGKSVLARYLVDNVLVSDAAQTTSYFFFKENFADQKTAVAALCALLRQIFLQQPQLLSPSIIAQFRSDGKTLTESFPSLFEMLIKVSAQSSTQVVCLLDALDECEEGDRRELTAALSKFYNNSSDQEPPLKFILTSRPYIQIQRDFRRLENSWPTIHLRGEDDKQIAKIAKEINIFARSRINDISESLSLEAWETKFRKQQIMKTKHRTYLWVKVALDVIENILSFTEDSVKDALRTIPEGLDKLYESIINRSHDVEKARKLLHVVLSAARPLTLREISVALAMSESHQDYSEIKLEPYERLKVTLRATCGLFVIIVDGKIYFLHQTAKEFLVNSRNGEIINKVNMPHNMTQQPFLFESIQDLGIS
ncbi:ankyrin repeat protein [Colletotrichum karsti]|uniref:Ankyrin repeat protein n=1 Tax=Colletotrichum karsti TaxID=1095194 RepID=A0A9P6LHN8_9PEZI|nr:ankyrin repeat protein [Colletotrichum karsti]KAF9873361.1 ankyrin repeat protein [Colletotrichum karsti]